MVQKNISISLIILLFFISACKKDNSVMTEETKNKNSNTSSVNGKTENTKDKDSATDGFAGINIDMHVDDLKNMQGTCTKWTQQGEYSAYKCKKINETIKGVGIVFFKGAFAYAVFTFNSKADYNVIKSKFGEPQSERHSFTDADFLNYSGSVGNLAFGESMPGDCDYSCSNGYCGFQTWGSSRSEFTILASDRPDGGKNPCRATLQNSERANQSNLEKDKRNKEKAKDLGY